MEITYANKKIEKVFTDYNAMIKEIGAELTRAVKKTMLHLEAAEEFGDYLKLGLGHPEQLKGFKEISYSVRLTKNIRLIIEPNATEDTLVSCKEIKIKGVCDYHGGKENWYVS